MVSVIMCIYKEPVAWIKESIHSILMQTIRDLELIIVVDNPCVLRDVKAYISFCASNDNRVKIIQNDINIGPSASRNIGINAAAGEYIAIMDSDDISSFNRLEKELGYLLNQDVDVVGSKYELIDEEDNIVGNSKSVKKDLCKLLRYYNFYSSSTLLIKKQKILDIDGYRFFNTCEDYDLLLRLLSNKCKFGFINESLIKYRVSDGSRSNASVFATREDYFYIRHLYKERCGNNNHDTYEKEKYLKYISNKRNKSKNVIRSYELFYEGLKQFSGNPIRALINILKSIICAPTYIFRELYIRARITLL